MNVNSNKNTISRDQKEFKNMKKFSNKNPNLLNQ